MIPIISILVLVCGGAKVLHEMRTDHCARCGHCTGKRCLTKGKAR